MRTPCTDTPPLGLGAIASDSWASWLDTVAVATHLCLLGRGGPTDTDSSSQATAPLKKVKQVFHLQTSHSTLYSLKAFGLQSVGLSSEAVHFLFH